MITMEEIIGDLLLQHNCVIVPAFGGFVTQRIGAQINTVSGTMTPPRKAVLFNRQLINNDGLLISAYAHRNNTDYNHAQQQITRLVGAWGEQLRNGHRISIDRVGFLFLDQERNLCFEQDRFYNLLMESYGMSTIHFVSVSDAIAQDSHRVMQEMVKEALAEPVVEFDAVQRIEPVRTETKEEPKIIVLEEKQQRPVIRRWRYAAAAALLPIAFYSFWIPLKTDVLESGVLSLQDFNPFRKNVPASYRAPASGYEPKHTAGRKRQLEAIPEGVSVYSYSVDDERYIPVRVAGDETASPETASPVTVTEQLTVNTVQQSLSRPAAGSHIIVGCFGDDANARNLVASLRSKGYDAYLLEGKGLIRVSAGNGARFSELQPRLKAEGLEAWLLK